MAYTPKFSRLFVLAIAALFFGSSAGMAAVETYTLDLDHSTIEFSIKHLGLSKTRGQFSDATATLTWDDENLKNSMISGSVQVKSIDTRNAKRDDHLKSPDFFDAEKFPTISLTKTRITKSSSGKFKLYGNLTIKNVTKPVSFDLHVSPATADPFGGTRRSFTGSFSINRFDYNLNFAGKLANGTFIVGDTVDIHLDIEGVLSK